MQEWVLILFVYVEGDFRDTTRIAQFPDFVSCEQEGHALQLDFMDRATFAMTAQLFDHGATIDKDTVRARTVALFDCIKVPVEGSCKDQECIDDSWRKSTTMQRLYDRSSSD